MIVPSKRSAIAPFLVMDVMDAAERVQASGKRVMHLEVGQPGTSAPRRVIEAAHRALDKQRLGYTHALGMPELRRRIAQHYQRAYGMKIDSRWVVVTAGASGAFVLASLVLFDPGARVAIARPGYPCYGNILKALGLVPVEVPVGRETSYRLTPAALDALDEPVQGLILESPANPTGTLLDREALQALVHYADEKGIRVISDEIYHGLVYGGRRAETATAISDAAVVVNSFSKYFSMTGWRLGWMIIPPELLRPVELLAQNLVICPSALAQHAALAAFDSYSELEAHVIVYEHNRKLLIEMLRNADVTELAPAEGAFYIYADVSRWTDDSRTFCKRLLKDTGVAITPGVDFDPAHGHHTVRLSYCTETSEVMAGAERFVEWLGRQER